MQYEWDEGKREANIIKHGLDFYAADNFNWDTAVIEPDMRANYSEPRFIATGYIDSRLHVLVFTERNDKVRIIGLRKANEREVRKYETQT